MSKITYRQILVIGDNHKQIAAKYSADTKVEPYIKMKKSETIKHMEEDIELLENALYNKILKKILTNEQYDEIKNYYLYLKNLSVEDYFIEQTVGCVYDEVTGDAYTNENPNAFYKYERCQQHRLEVTGEEGDFSTPFPLKDGTKSYSARFNDIDWDLIHHNPQAIELYKRAWELVVDDDKPKNEREEHIKQHMCERKNYFDNFNSKEDYVNHSTSLWYWGVATNSSYEEVNYKISDMDWCVNFFDTYLKNLKDTNPLITIYEVHSLD